MATVVIINTDETHPFVKLRSALTDTKPILTRIGAILEAGAQAAFSDQKFGSVAWPHRYPNQAEPFVNLAGALSDFAAGSSNPKSRRFSRRPAVMDTGRLLRSIRSRVTGRDRVEVGTTVEYAPAHQWGGVTSQPVTDDAKKKIAAWLLTPGGKPYMSKMTFLLQKNRATLDTKVAHRPFLGVTATMEKDITSAVEELVAEAATGGNS